jgi:hypothetical protein
MNVAVAGEIECNKTACLMILSKVVEDPQSGSCLNVSYADVSGPVANYNPTGSPYANHTSQHSPVQTGNFNSSPSMSSSITAGKLEHEGIFRTYEEDPSFIFTIPVHSGGLWLSGRSGFP